MAHLYLEDIDFSAQSSQGDCTQILNRSASAVLKSLFSQMIHILSFFKCDTKSPEPPKQTGKIPSFEQFIGLDLQDSERKCCLGMPSHTGRPKEQLHGNSCEVKLAISSTISYGRAAYWVNNVHFMKTFINVNSHKRLKWLLRVK